MNRIKVSCDTCKFFIKKFAHNNKNKNPDLLLCDKIGFRIVEKGDPPIYCDYYEKKDPFKKIDSLFYFTINSTSPHNAIQPTKNRTERRS